MFMNWAEAISAHSKLLIGHRYCPTQVEGSPECEACVLIWTAECPELHWGSSAGEVADAEKTMQVLRISLRSFLGSVC